MVLWSNYAISPCAFYIKDFSLSAVPYLFGLGNEKKLPGA